MKSPQMIWFSILTTIFGLWEHRAARDNSGVATIFAGLGAFFYINWSSVALSNGVYLGRHIMSWFVLLVAFNLGCFLEGICSMGNMLGKFLERLRVLSSEIICSAGNMLGKFLERVRVFSSERVRNFRVRSHDEPQERVKDRAKNLNSENQSQHSNIAEDMGPDAKSFASR